MLRNGPNLFRSLLSQLTMSGKNNHDREAAYVGVGLKSANGHTQKVLFLSVLFNLDLLKNAICRHIQSVDAIIISKEFKSQGGYLVFTIYMFLVLGAVMLEGR